MIFLVTLLLTAFNLVSKSVFVNRLVRSGILFSTVVGAEIVAKPLISEILFSTAVNAEVLANPLMLGILPSTLVILVLKSVFLTRLRTSGIFFAILAILSSKCDPSFSYLVLETKFVSILLTLLTNSSYSVFFTTSFLTALLNLAKSIGTDVSLSVSNLSTSVFRLAQFNFSAKLLASICDILFKSVFVT